MSLFQAMVLAINTSILAVLFAFSTWLYASSRAEVGLQVQGGLARAAAMTDALARLKRRELDALAQSMAVSPMLKGALSTGDVATIRDVLDTLARKNGVPSVSLSAGAQRGFFGKASVGERTLVVRRPADRALLDEWTSVTGVRYALLSGPAAADNLPAEDHALASRPPPAGMVVPLDGEQGRWYARRARLLDGGVEAVVFAQRAPFWASFERRRNSLAVLGFALFFAGLVLSAVFARWAQGYAAAGAAQAHPDFSRLLREIDEARALLLKDKP